MKKTHLALALVACAAFGVPAIAEEGAGYLQSSAGIVRSGSGLCWRTSSWTPAAGAEGCDQSQMAQAAPQEAPEMAPAIQADPQLASQMAEFEMRETVVHFDFDKAVLTPKAKAMLDEIAAMAKSGDAVSRALVIGHADRIGTGRYNHALAMRRAQAVANWLRSKHGVSAEVITVEERGEDAPVVSCGKGKGAIRCLAPNRRVEVLLVIQADAAPR